MQNKISEVIDIQEIIFKIRKNWFLFCISIFITFCIAFSYNRYTSQVYLVETSILVKDENEMSTASDLLYEKVSSSKKSLENKENLIKSFPLIYRTLKDLRFDISYYIKGHVKTTETFLSPIILDCSDTEGIVGKKVRIEIIDKNRFLFIDEGNKEEYIRNFDESFLFYNKPISVRYNHLFISDQNPIIIVKFYSLKQLVNSYKDLIHVSQKSKESTILNITMLTQDQMKGVVFLNKLVDNFINNELAQKNTASIATVNFINNQLMEMSDSLALIEQQIQEYKNNNQITDLSYTAQSIYTNIVALETEIANAETVDSYYNYLSDYLINGKGLEGVSVPSLFGIHDESLNLLISQLVEKQTKKNILIDGGQVNNPAISKYNRQIKQLVINLQEAIKTSRSANNLLLIDAQNRILEKKKELSDIPEKRREIGSIERLQVISENIYTFLLKKRAEAKITTSSNTSDSKVLEPAILFNKPPVYPNKNRSYIVALIIGFFMPLFFLIMKDFLVDKVVRRLDLINATSIPLIGMIRRNYSGYTLLSNHNPKSIVFEGFRALRSNLNFLNSSGNNKVYLVTSSISGEGKTYLSCNLGIVFALSGKKTILVGTDLRRPRLYKEFGIDNNLGLSNYILSEEMLEKVVLKSEIKNLDILVSGPIPDNPSSLLTNDRFSNMINELKKQYDIIILDTPPLGLVADCLTIMKHVDVNLYVVRQDYTRRRLLSSITDMYNTERVKNMHIVFNDVKEDSDSYGYDYGYGYGYNERDILSSGYFEEEVK